MMGGWMGVDGLNVPTDHGDSSGSLNFSMQ